MTSATTAPGLAAARPRGAAWRAVWPWVLLLPGAASLPAAEWGVPMGGNAYLMASGPGSDDGLHRGGTEVRWHDPQTTWAVWFHLDRPAMSLDDAFANRQA